MRANLSISWFAGWRERTMGFQNDGADQGEQVGGEGRRVVRQKSELNDEMFSGTLLLLVVDGSLKLCVRA